MSLPVKETSSVKSGEINYTKEIFLLALIEAKPEEIVTYEQLRHLTNSPVSSSNWMLKWAVRQMLLKHNIHFENIRNVGYQRSASCDLVKAGKKSIEHIRRTTKKAGCIMDTANRSELNRDQALEHDAQRGVIAAIHAASRKQTGDSRVIGNSDPKVFQ
ncbi:MAG: hypothetical protein LKH33_06695 [Acetobacter sp.]|jgi:hypothetical protein|nr:hypothetical protein [Acetobacter sp.]MCH4060466.1 hypothetical protein [Acetobacter sp.]MCH4087406.1 hypothetical protein [Acetobacter sp.]MCI1293924.1 hypothetical protein [Acetobacter sp.]MCI1320482.1 hypothetical protein [Acetobacter sp.]